MKFLLGGGVVSVGSNKGTSGLIYREYLFVHIRGFQRNLEETGKSRRFDRLNFEWKSRGYHLDSKPLYQ
jgi:hypothetical protein